MRDYRARHVIRASEILLRSPLFFLPALGSTFFTLANLPTRACRQVPFLGHRITGRCPPEFVRAPLTASRRLLLALGPALLHGLTDLPPGCCRQSPLPAIWASRCCPSFVPASLESGYGAVKTVTFCFQFRDDICCVHLGVFSLFVRI